MVFSRSSAFGKSAISQLELLPLSKRGIAIFINLEKGKGVFKKGAQSMTGGGCLKKGNGKFFGDTSNN